MHFEKITGMDGELRFLRIEIRDISENSLSLIL